MMEFSKLNTSQLNSVTYSIVQSCALKKASNQCIQPAWMSDQAMNGKKGMSKLLVHSL